MAVIDLTDTGPGDHGTRERTTVPVVAPEVIMPAPRRIGGIGRQGVLNLVGAIIMASALTLLLFGRLTPLTGLVGWVLTWWVLFLVSYSLLISQTEDGPAIVDNVVTVGLWSAASLVVLTLAFVVIYTVARGAPALPHLNFYTQDLSRTSQKGPLTSGGISHAIIGTVWTISIALVITVPLGLLCAVYLSEQRGRTVRLVRTIVEAMASLPDVIAGLFVFATWLLMLRFQPSGFAAAMALSIAMLPIIVRTADVVLRLVPGNLREASAALGAPAWRTVFFVVLPTARSGLATAVILGAARGIGETAPVLLTAGYSLFYNSDPFHGPMVSLPLLAFTLVSSGEPNMVTRGFGAASVLLIMVVVIFLAARTIGGRGPGQISRAGQRRLARRSLRDAQRFAAKRRAD